MVPKFSRNNKNLDCDSFIAHMYMYMLKKKKKKQAWEAWGYGRQVRMRVNEEKYAGHCDRGECFTSVRKFSAHRGFSVYVWRSRFCLPFIGHNIRNDVYVLLY